jgi:hypothetical protein
MDDLEFDFVFLFSSNLISLSLHYINDLSSRFIDLIPTFSIFYQFHENKNSFYHLLICSHGLTFSSITRKDSLTLYISHSFFEPIFMK